MVPLQELSLREFLEKTNQDRPQITGGGVLLTNASLTSAMILMALKITLKKEKVSLNRRFLRQKIKALSTIQIQLADAAEHDLQVFDQYRHILRSKAKNRQLKLDLALQKATDSLLEVCKVLTRAQQHTVACKEYTDLAVVSDLNAGQLILQAVYDALIALAEGNIAGMPAELQAKYDSWKNELQAV